MLKSFLTTAYIILSLFILNSAASAQGGVQYVNEKHLKVFESTSEANTESLGAEKPASFISSRILRAFNKTFQGASPRWFSINGQYLARFTENGKSTHALFNNNGYMEYSVTRGPEEILPARVKQLIQNEYKAHTVQVAFEVNSLGITAWLAHLRSENSFIIVKIIDNEIVESTMYKGSK